MFQNSARDGKLPIHRSLFWGIRCEGGKKYSQIVRQKYHISMAALDPTSVKNGKEVVSLIAERDGSEFLLCNLQKDSVLQVNLNLFFDKGEKVVFSLKGQGVVHLTGFLIQDDNDQSDGPLHSKHLNDSIVLAKDKVKASANKSIQSKKNLSSHNDSWKVESKEIVTPTSKLFASPPKKNSEKFQTNITGVLEGDNWIVESEEVQNSASPAKKSVSVSPSQRPTPQKKLFDTSKQEEEDSSDEDTDDTSEDEEHGEDAKQLLMYAKKRPISSLEEEDDEEDSDDDDDSEMDDSSEEEMPAKKNSVKNLPSSKKLKAETSTPLPGKKSASKNVAEIIDIDEDSKNGDMNSSIGRTPMPKKKQKSILSNSKEASFSKDKDSSSSDSDDEVVTEKQLKQQTDLNKSATQLNTSGNALGSEKKKKKKKKKKANLEDSTAANESNTSLNTSSSKAGNLTNAQYSKKLPGGVAYEDIRVGNGPLAQKGRMVFVYYTGKLENNVVFDSCQPGRDKPFSFKLGSGSVIKGWDLSVEGMKVGGKRRIKIPPNMGYKNQRQGPIPANSTLYFVVELKAVI